MKLRSNQGSCLFIVLVLAFSAALAACVTPPLEPQYVPTPAATPPPPTADDLSVVLTVQEPIVVNQTALVTIAVASTKDVSDAYVNFYLYSPGNPRGTRDSQKVALRAGETFQISKEVVFSQHGNYDLIATISLPVGLSVADSKSVAITWQGGAVNPVHTLGPEPVEIRGAPIPERTATPFPGSALTGRGNTVRAPEGFVTLRVQWSMKRATVLACCPQRFC